MKIKVVQKRKLLLSPENAMSKEKTASEGKYRPNVALLLMNKDDELLICERIEDKGAWQFPQGGVDEGEGLISALRREVREEIGLEPDDYELLDSRGGYRYEYAPKVKERKKKKTGCIGQEQTYFLCRLTAKKKKVNVNQSPAEFQDIDWIKPKKFKLSWLPEFKKEVYKQVFKDFFKCEIS